MDYNLRVISVGDIQRLLLDAYLKSHGGKIPRDLHINKSRCCYEKVGAVLFALKGSPPKGYALFITTWSDENSEGYLNIYDPPGRRTRRIRVMINDLDTFSDTDILQRTSLAGKPRLEQQPPEKEAIPHV